MTIQTVFSRLNKQFVHQYDSEILMAWINDLERDISQRFLYPTFSSTPTEYTERISESDDLIAEDPDIYIQYLICQICLANEEYDRYNNHMAIFNQKMQEWKDWYIRTHRPVYKGKFKV